MSKDNYPTAPLQSTGAIAEAIEKQKQDALKPVRGVNADPIPTLWVDVDISDVRRAIEEARTKNDFFAAVKGKDTLHLITGDIKSMGDLDAGPHGRRDNFKVYKAHLSADPRI